MRVTKLFLAGIITTTLTFAAPSLAAQGPPDHSRARAATKNRDDKNRPIFSRQETRIIRDFFSRRDNLPPGLAKRDRLPPGLEKQLRRNGQLPPGLQKRVDPLPNDVLRRLLPLPRRYERGIIGRDVVLIDRDTNGILDILRGVF